jgi:hypothetical protein
VIVGLGPWGIVGAAGADGVIPVAVGATPHAPAGCAGAGELRGSRAACGGIGDAAGGRVSARVIAIVSLSGAVGEGAGAATGIGEAIGETIGEGACGIVADTFVVSSATRAICTVMLSWPPRSFANLTSVEHA